MGFIIYDDGRSLPNIYIVGSHVYQRILKNIRNEKYSVTYRSRHLMALGEIEPLPQEVIQLLRELTMNRSGIISEYAQIICERKMKTRIEDNLRMKNENPY